MIASSTSKPKRQRWPVHGLSLKISAAAGLATLLPAGVLAVLGLGIPFWVPLVAAVLTAGATYGAAYHYLARRLELARSTLKQIRQRDFASLEQAHLPRGDELNALIWQVYRTGLTLQREIETLQNIESYRREFLGNVSHELKTPIFSIRGFAETLHDGALDDPRVNRSFLDKILRNADRLANLANDLTEISRIETGDLKMTHAPFNLARVARDVVESLEPIAEAKGIKVTARIPARIPDVFGDANRIRQVLVNLIENAIKYNDEGGYVDVVARLLPSGEVKVSVVDDGIGIAPEHQSRLTERFYRVDKSRSRAQGGTGLGLAIVKHILAAHDRALMIDSQEGRGATFGFMLSTASVGKATKPSGGRALVQGHA